MDIVPSPSQLKSVDLKCLTLQLYIVLFNDTYNFFNTNLLSTNVNKVLNKGNNFTSSRIEINRHFSHS